MRGGDRAGPARPRGGASRGEPLPRAVRRVVLPFVLACIHVLVCRWPASSQEPAGDARPNVLVIMVDDLGYRDVGFHGATEIETPHLDRLARAGVVFSNGYVAHPVCSPSRAGLMTGRYPSRFGMEINLTHAPHHEHHGLPLEEPTVARYLREAGYRTGMVGKWHLGAAPAFHPLNRGFDYFYGFTGGGHDYFRVDLTKSPLREYLLPLNDGRGATGFSGYLTDVLTDRAIEFVDVGGDEPFFLYLSYNAPHTPLQAPAETVRKYRHVEDVNRRSYLAMVDSLDHNIGRLVTALRETGRWEETLTFFLSDNGGVSGTEADWADNRPLRNGKGSLFEGGIRVPFVASWPARWRGGTVFEPMVISLDVAATALALAGAPAAADPPLDGVNLDPFIRGAAPGVPHQTLFWATDRIKDADVGYAVRTADAKLVKDRLGEGPALFDLRTDPGETRDRLAEDPETVARLAALWNDWNARNSTDFFFWTQLYESYRHEMRCRMERYMRASGAGQAPLTLTGPEAGEPLTPVRAAATAPLPPAGLAAAGGDGSIDLAWDDPGDASITFYEFRLIGPQGPDWSAWTVVDVCSYAATGHTLFGLTNGVTYRVQLRAHNAAGASEPSETSAAPQAQSANDSAGVSAASAPGLARAETPSTGAPWILMWALIGALLALLAVSAAATLRRNAARRRSGR